MNLSRLWQRFTRPARRPNTARLSVRALEERAVPTLNVQSVIAVGSGAGMDTTVKVYNSSGALIDTFKPYPLPGGTFFQGGCFTAGGDINGDGVADVVTGAGATGGPHVKVFNGADIVAGSANPTVIREFFAYAPNFTLGVKVAVGDLNGDGLQDIVTGIGPGESPHVVAYNNGFVTQQILNFFPLPLEFRGGVNVACGDVGGDQISEEVVTGAGPGGTAKVGVFDYNGNPTPTQAFTRLAEFDAYPGFMVGANVACGYYTNNRDPSNFLFADIVTGPAGNGGPDIKTFRLLDATNDALGNPDWQFFKAGEVFAYAPTLIGSVSVGTIRNGSLDDFVTGFGPGGGPDLKIFNQTSVPDLATYTPTQRLNFFPFDPTFTGGIFV